MRMPARHSIGPGSASDAGSTPKVSAAPSVSPAPFVTVTPRVRSTASGGALIVPNSDPTNVMAFVSTSGATKLAAVQCYYSGNCHVVPYNSMRGDPYFNVDTRIAKNIKLGERRNLQLAFQVDTGIL